MSTPQALTSQLADALIAGDQDAVIAILAQVIAYITDEDINEDISESTSEDTASPPLAKAHKDAGQADSVVPRLLPYPLLRVYPHERVVRRVNPANFSTVIRKELAPGVTALVGDGEAIESLRFDADQFSDAEVEQWVEKMGPTVDAVHIDTIESEPASVCDICGKSPCECTDGNFIITKAGEERRLAYGIVMRPAPFVDSQGDVCSAEEIEKMAHSYLSNSREFDLQHLLSLDGDKAVVVESYVTPCDMTIGNKFIEKGAWVVCTFFKSEELWGLVKSGAVKSYSIAGRGTRIPQ